MGQRLHMPVAQGVVEPARAEGCCGHRSDVVATALGDSSTKRDDAGVRIGCSANPVFIPVGNPLVRRTERRQPSPCPSEGERDVRLGVRTLGVQETPNNKGTSNARSSAR